MNINNTNVRVSTALRIRPPVNGCEDNYLDVLPIANLIRFGNSVCPVSSDYLFPCTATQDHVFELPVKGYIDRFISGDDDITFIAFGPKYSGKTFTLFGPGVHCTDSAAFYGIFPRLATYLFGQYEPSLFTGPSPRCIILVSFIEISGAYIKNLLNHKVIARINDSVSGYKTEDILRHVESEQCTSARDVINCLQIAMSNRLTEPGSNSSHSSHVFAQIVFEQPVLQKDGEFRQTKTSACFTDIGCTMMEHPMFVFPTGERAIVNEDIFVLTALAKMYKLSYLGDDNFLPHSSHLLNILKDSFSGKRETLVMCCVPPSYIQVNNTVKYLNTLASLHCIRLNYQLNINEAFEFARQNTPMNRTNSLILEAESLLSKLSVSKSITEEEQEQLNNWLAMKRECEDESLNALSHGQLECIEEVTESEEEVPSCHEKIYESPLSMDHSLYESEDGENKVCQFSDSDFSLNLGNMFIQFNSFVDNFVDSFKGNPNLSPVKEHKRVYSAVRRGGMPLIQNEMALKESCSPLVSDELGQLHYNGMRRIQSKNSPICPQPNTYHRERESQPSTSKEQKMQRAQGLRPDIYISDSSSNDEVEEPIISKTKKNRVFSVKPKEKKEEAKEPAQKEEYLNWGPEASNVTDEVLYQLLENSVKDMVKLKDSWLSWMQKVLSTRKAGREGREGVIISTQHDRNQHMLKAITGFLAFMDHMKDIIEADNDSFSTLEENDCGFYHMIRTHRSARMDLVKIKNQLDGKVKEKTASDQELRDYIMADEMIEAVDNEIEYLNYIIVHNSPPTLKLPKTEVSQVMLKEFKQLSSFETKHLLVKYFYKVVDLRENGKQLEASIADLDQKLEFAKSKIAHLTRTVQEMRSHQSQLHTVTRYPQSEAAYGDCSIPPSALALPEGSKSERRVPCIPQQNLSKLQVNKVAPPAKVTFTNKKLIIEQSNKH